MQISSTLWCIIANSLKGNEKPLRLQDRSWFWLWGRMITLGSDLETRCSVCSWWDTSRRFRLTGALENGNVVKIHLVSSWSYLECGLVRDPMFTPNYLQQWRPNVLLEVQALTLQVWGHLWTRSAAEVGGSELWETPSFSPPGRCAGPGIHTSS